MRNTAHAQGAPNERLRRSSFSVGIAGAGGSVAANGSRVAALRLGQFSHRSDRRWSHV